MTISDIQPKIDARVAEDAPAVVVYTTRTCTVCPGVIANIKSRGYTPKIIKADEDDAAFYYITKTLGYQQVPVVYVSRPDAEDVHWSGRAPHMIVQHLPKVAA